MKRKRVTIFVDDTFFSCSNHCPSRFNPRFNRGIRECASRRAGTNTLTWKSKHLCASFADASSPAVHTGACLYVTHASSVHVAPRYLRDDQRRVRMCSSIPCVCTYYVSRGIHRSKVYRRVYTLDIDQSGIIRAKRISADTTLATAFIPTGITTVYSSIGRGKEESSIERIGPKSTSRISTYSMYSICNPFPSLAVSQRIAETRDRLNIARQFEKRHQRPHRGVTRVESK